MKEAVERTKHKEQVEGDMDGVPPRAKLLIDRLGLEPHPEGGYYKETYRGLSHDKVERGTDDDLLLYFR